MKRWLFFLLPGLVLFTLASARASELPAPLPLPLQADGHGHQLLPAGNYQGNFVIDHSADVICAKGAVIDAGGQGNALLITAPNVQLQNCTIRNWGKDLTALNSAIFVARTATGAAIIHNNLSGPGFGIWLDSTPDTRVLGNRIEGDLSLRSQDRGNGIQVFNTHNALVADNEVWHTRDGIYIETADGNELRHNYLHDLRYGIHYMYSQRNRIIGNHTERTRTGYALMQSHHLTVIGNRSDHDQNYGILLNYITYSELRDNRIDQVHPGTGITGVAIDGAEGKALFVYNSEFNTIEHNYLGHSNLGIHLTAGSEDNSILGNVFDHNQQQVKYVATRPQEWSKDGKGNFWSDYLGWDRNGDGIGDVPYEPNDNIDRLLWTYPQARLLMHSPAVETLRLAQQAFPVIKAQGVRDSAPLMQMPVIDPDKPAARIAGRD